MLRKCSFPSVIASKQFYVVLIVVQLTRHQMNYFLRRINAIEFMNLLDSVDVCIELNEFDKLVNVFSALIIYYIV